MNIKVFSLLVVGLVLAVIGGIYGGSLNPQMVTERVIEKSPTLGGVTNYDELGIGPIAIDWHSGVMGSGTSTASWFNNTGQTQFIDNAFLSMIATSSSLIGGTIGPIASSSYRLFVGTSTLAATATQMNFTGGDSLQVMGAGFNPFAYGNLLNNNATIIDGWFIATSTTATSTSNVFMMTQISGANNGSSTVAGDERLSLFNPIPVRNGEYVLFFLRQEAPLACTGNAGKICETATSTNRGFNILWTFRTFATTTEPSS